MLERLQGIVRQCTGNEKIIITGEMVLLTDLGLNSYELVELICELEEEFGVEIPDRVISKLKTVQNVLDYIAAQDGE